MGGAAAAGGAGAAALLGAASGMMAQAAAQQAAPVMPPTPRRAAMQMLPATRERRWPGGRSLQDRLKPAGGGSSSSPLTSTVFGGGPIVGVASTSKAKTIREFNHKNHYNDWQFIYDPTMDRGGPITTPAQPALQVSAPLCSRIHLARAIRRDPRLRLAGCRILHRQPSLGKSPQQ